MTNESKTVDYSPELFSDVMENMVDYWQLGETVCGAQDPAVISIGPEFFKKYPELAGLNFVRVIDRYVNPWKSDTLLEFSDRDISSDEYQTADDYGDDD